MTSWQLLRHLTAFWNALDNPVFLRETEHPPIWHGAYARLSRMTGLSLVFGGMLCYGGMLLVLYLHNLLILMLPLLFAWTILVGLTLAPVIVAEREKGTWVVLRTTPLSMESIVLGKASGALWWMSDLLHLMVALLLLAAMGIGLLSLVITPTDTSGTPSGVPGELLCAATLLVPLGTAVVFVMDRAQQFVLTALAALAASATSHNGRSAMAAASMATLITWWADVGLAVALLALYPDRMSVIGTGQLLSLAALGPLVGYLAAFSIEKTILLLLGTLLLRELAVRAMWRWTLYAAREIV